MRGARRALAVVAGLALGVFELYAVLWVWLVVLIAAQAPDPFEHDGEPCCFVPDTWGDVAESVAWAIGSATVYGALVALSVALIGWGSTGTRPRWRRLALGPLAAAGLVGAILLVAAVLNIGNARYRADVTDGAGALAPAPHAVSD